ncbi:hypothetical protein J7I85_22315 [Arthrobacter sp. ISL-65]|nr:hypothetical protein [Arthrobacter sp. ISL-65]
MTKTKGWGWYPPRFCAELGRFAFVFADVEGVAGELIVVHHGYAEMMKGDWSRSGKQWIAALRECFDSPNFQEMCDALDELTKTRNLFMHGEWSFLSDTVAMVMKRHHDKSSQSPGYEMADNITPEMIASQTQHLIAIEVALGNYLGDKMGIS